MNGPLAWCGILVLDVLSENVASVKKKSNTSATTYSRDIVITTLGTRLPYYVAQPCHREGMITQHASSRTTDALCSGDPLRNHTTAGFETCFSSS